MKFVSKKFLSIKKWHSRRSLYTQIACKGFPPVFWSKGYATFAEQNSGLREVLGRTEKRWSLNKFLNLYSPNAKSYWIPLTSHSKFGRKCPLDWFVRHILPEIKTTFTLITTDGPANVPSDIDSKTCELLLDNENLICWYSQNVVEENFHTKLIGIPLGIDLHADRGFGVGWQLFYNFSLIASSFENKADEVIADCCLNKNSEEREALSRIIEGKKGFFLPKERLSQISLWELYSKSKYVLSPSGVGADCHRTWEALYMGASVICKDVGIGRIYDGLPVYQVSSWEELEDPNFFDMVDSFVANKINIWSLSSKDVLKKFYFRSNQGVL